MGEFRAVRCQAGDLWHTDLQTYDTKGDQRFVHTSESSKKILCERVEPDGRNRR